MTGDQGMLSDVMKMNRMLTPEPKPMPPDEEGIQRTSYHLFMDVRPLPIPVLEEYLEAGKVPNVAWVHSIPRLRRNIAQTEAQRAITDSDDVDVLEKMDEALTNMRAELKMKEDDLHVFEQFTWEALSTQQPPEGWVYQCGIYFDLVITICIIINIFFMCTYHHNQSDSWETAQSVQNIIFTAIFTVEMILKHLGLGYKTYWTDPLNAFDGVVTIVSIMFIPMEGGAIAGLFRTVRIFRLIKRAPQLRALMTTLIMTIPSISNVFMVLFLVFFIGATISVELFGKVRYGTSISAVDNFETWLDAMHLLWRNALGNWRSTYYDAVVMIPDCTNLDKDAQPGLDKAVTDCGNSFTGVLFFVAFQVVATFAVLNLVIAIILNAFTWCYSLEPSEITGSLVISTAHLKHFKAIWDRYDIDGDGSMPLSSLQSFLAISQHIVPNLFIQGLKNQKDEFIYSDYSSFGTGPNKSDANDYERQCRANYDELLQKIVKIEESKEMFERLEERGEDVWLGENTTVFEEDFERWNKTKTTKLLTKKDGVTTLEGVEYLTLVYILVQEPLGLSAHDRYVINDFRDPFLTVLPGYLPGSHENGRIILPDDDSVKDSVQGVLGGFERQFSKESSEEEDEESEEEEEDTVVLPSKADLPQKLIGPSKEKGKGSQETGKGKEHDHFALWCAENNELLLNYFERYDLDNSGTLNDEDELQYLTINIVKALGLRISLSEMDKILEPAMQKINAGNHWNMDQFAKWFYTNFVQLDC